jgi:hypothetical protein
MSAAKFKASLLLLALVFTAGCGPDYKARAKVKGHVKFFDKNLTAGTVGFTAADGRVGAANIDFDGNYEMTDAPIGEVTITVKVPTMGAGSDAHKGFVAKPPGNMTPMPRQGEADDKAYTPVIDPKKIVSIPGKYGSVETSGLKYTVEKGEQTKDITLTP